MPDIALAAIQLCDFAGIGIDAEHLEPNDAVAQHQRQTDIAQANNADHCLF